MDAHSPEQIEPKLSKEARDAMKADARIASIERICSKIAYVGMALWAISTVELWLRAH